MKNLYDPEFVKELFNKMSSSYERVNYITSFGFSIRWRKQFLKSIPKNNNKLSVLDLMTGMGEIWHPVKNYLPNCEFTALDFSEGMLSHARHKNEKQFKNSITVTNQDALNSDFLDESFDIIVSAFGLKTFNNQQLVKLAKETKRILKPGGSFSFIEVSEPPNRILKLLYKLHLKHIVPFCGKLLLGNPQEYKMLWKYTSAYKNSHIAKKIFEDVGLEVNYRSYFGGCASGISGRKI